MTTIAFIGAGSTCSRATLDRRAAVAGADYVVTSFQVGGLRPSTIVDFGDWIPPLASAR